MKNNPTGLDYQSEVSEMYIIDSEFFEILIGRVATKRDTPDMQFTPVKFLR